MKDSVVAPPANGFLFPLYLIRTQIEFKNVQYKIQALKMPPPPKPKTVVPKFKDFTKGAFKNGEVYIPAHLTINAQFNDQLRR